MKIEYSNGNTTGAKESSLARKTTQIASSSSTMQHPSGGTTLLQLPSMEMDLLLFDFTVAGQRKYVFERLKT